MSVEDRLKSIAESLEKIEEHQRRQDTRTKRKDVLEAILKYAAAIMSLLGFWSTVVQHLPFYNAIWADWTIFLIVAYLVHRAIHGVIKVIPKGSDRTRRILKGWLSKRQSSSRRFQPKAHIFSVRNINVFIIILILAGGGILQYYHNVTAQQKANLSAFEKKLQTLRWIAYEPIQLDPEVEPKVFGDENNIRQELKVLHDFGFNGLITFASDGTNGLIPKVAHEVGFQGVIMGITHTTGDRITAYGVKDSIIVGKDRDEKDTSVLVPKGSKITIGKQTFILGKKAKIAVSPKTTLPVADGAEAIVEKGDSATKGLSVAVKEGSKIAVKTGCKFTGTQAFRIIDEKGTAHSLPPNSIVTVKAAKGFQVIAARGSQVKVKYPSEVQAAVEAAHPDQESAKGKAQQEPELYVDAYCVGQHFDQREYSAADVLSCMRLLKQRTNLPVTATLSPDGYDAFPEISKTVDWFFPDVHVDWYDVAQVNTEAERKNNKPDALEQTQILVRHMADIRKEYYPDKSILLKIICFPSAEVTLATEATQADFYHQFLTYSQHNVNFPARTYASYFSAFDITWKIPPPIRTWPKGERHLGLFHTLQFRECDFIRSSKSKNEHPKSKHEHAKSKYERSELKNERSELALAAYLRNTKSPIFRTFQRHFPKEISDPPKLSKLISALNHMLDSPLFNVHDVRDANGLIRDLKEAKNPVSQHLVRKFSEQFRKQLKALPSSKSVLPALQQALVHELNRLLQEDQLYDKKRFKGVKLRDETKKLSRGNPQGEDLIYLNRALLEDAYPQKITRCLLNKKLVEATINGWEKEIKKNPSKKVFIRLDHLLNLEEDWLDEADDLQKIVAMRNRVPFLRRAANRLLLEAAYWHDNKQELEKSYNDKEYPSGPFDLAKPAVSEFGWGPGP